MHHRESSCESQLNKTMVEMFPEKQRNLRRGTHTILVAQSCTKNLTSGYLYIRLESIIFSVLTSTLMVDQGSE